MERKYVKIFIYGFTGCGKTTTARHLSSLLKFCFYDTDMLVEERYKVSVYRFIRDYGIDRFREVESEIFKELLSLMENAVISCGGGIFPIGADFRKTAIMEVFLDTPYSIISKRFKDISSTRPVIEDLLSEPLKIRDLYLSRLRFYERASFRVKEVDSFKAAKKIAEIYYEKVRDN